MLVWFLSRFPDLAGEAWTKITFRASLAAGVSFVLALVLGPRLIAWLGRRFREPIKCDSPEVQRLHQSKQATPTMGGLFLVAGLVAGLAAFGDLSNQFVQTALLVALGLAALGAVDDLVKLRGAGNGLSIRTKLLAQVVIAGVVAVVLYRHLATLPDEPALRLPWCNTTWSLGLGFIPWAVLVLVGSCNAVNLTDGLDGLAGGCLISATAAAGAVAYVAGHAELAPYVGTAHISGAGEMTILAGAMIGGLLGFLWFNCHPAQVFMGDTGSLPLGGLLGLILLVARQELLLLLVGGVFVVEAASVIVQVAMYKWRRRRVFLCAPIHHHFQLLGWPESRIVTRFWIASALCGLLGVASLKLTVHVPPVSPPSASIPFASQPGDPLR